MSERKFTRGLSKPGMAAQMRETIAQAVRESTCMSKPKLVDPVDYETFLVKSKTVIHNDPLRDMLLFPQDDVCQKTLGREFRTVCCSVPRLAQKEASSLLVRECVKGYTSKWNVVEYKYSKYAGGHQHLPKYQKTPDSLPEHLYEIDIEEDKDEDGTLTRNVLQTITKQGWLYKGPDSAHESSSIISFTRSFKRRYFYLKQQVDTTYILEFHKDDKKLDSKGAIFLDSATDVKKSSKKGRFNFEVHMQDHHFYLFAAETEQEMEDWIKTLRKVIESQETGSIHSISSEKYRDEILSPGRGGDSYKDSLENSMHPELVKYAKETDGQLAQARKENRQKMFLIYPELQRGPYFDDVGDTVNADFYKEQFGMRIVVRFKEFRLKLQSNVAEEGLQHIANPEPFFITLALYDAKEGKKISEDFHIDPNDPRVRHMIPEEVIHSSDRLNTVRGKSTEPELTGVSKDWVKHPAQGIFSVMNPHHEIYLVARIEKVLQGGIVTCAEPYIKGPDPKTAAKVNKQMRLCCSRLGHYRMPFGWAARPVFKPYTSDLEPDSDITVYRQEANRLTEEDLIKHLQDYRRPEKQSKWQVIPADFMVILAKYKAAIRNTVTSGLIPVKPFPDPPEQPPTLEIEEFLPDDGRYSWPHTAYTNHVYVYPKMLKYDSQKAFTKARNIACCIEVRDSDEEGAVPLQVIRGRPGISVFTTVVSAAVVHHQTAPEFYEEVKVALPTQLNDKHHLLFTFYHVACESSTKMPSKSTSNKRKHDVEYIIGYAWMPISRLGRVLVGEQALPLAVNLPAGYLSHEQLGLGKGNAGPDIKWVDGGKHLFKFDLRLVSTVYTKDQHLHNFFHHCQKVDESKSLATDMDTVNKLKSADNVDEKELLKFVKSMHAMDVSTMIQFLPTIFNQLFRLLPQTSSEDVALNAVRVLVHVVSEVSEAGKTEALHSYVKYVFQTEATAGYTKLTKTVHEELAKHLTTMTRPNNADLMVINKLLRFAWFFFEILIKSMAQHLLSTQKIKAQRNDRFPSDYQYRVQNLVQCFAPHITQKFRDQPVETKHANQALACFIKKCLTFMDRGAVFKLVNMYMDSFSPGDPKTLLEYKFEFLRILCCHEHYVPLNLPMMKKGHVKTYKDLKHDYTLSEEFCKNHFLIGLLLQEVKAALNEHQHTRRYAIAVLRNLLAKHSFDDRYSSKNHQGRIASLYLPFITVIIENKHRLMVRDSQHASPITPVANGDALHHQNTEPETPSKTSNAAPGNAGKSGAEPGTPSGSMRLNRDSQLLAMIAGQSPAAISISDPLPANSATASLASSTSSIQSAVAAADHKESKDNKPKAERSQSVGQQSQGGQSLGQSPFGVRQDKLDSTEVKDLLMCFMYIVKNLPEDVLLGWFNNSSEYDILDFLNVLEICMQQFKYLGKKKIFALSMIGDSRKALTMPVGRGKGGLMMHARAASAYGEVSADGFTTPTGSDADGLSRANQEASLAVEIGLTVLDVITQYSHQFKAQLEFKDGDNTVMRKIFDLYMMFLQTSQSEALLKHAFAALRLFVHKFPKVLFKGHAILCSNMCYELLRGCNSRLKSTRNESCALLYLLMKANFEFMKRKSFTRVHLQVIINVSQLLGEVVGLAGTRFQESLSIINSYANSDKAMQGPLAVRMRTNFPAEVKDLTKRIRTVLMATAQMKEHQNDPEMLVDLQYSLAKSYAATPELRKTWLENMAKIHVRLESYSEAAYCYLHIAALVAEYLKRREIYPEGCGVFKRISANVSEEEYDIKDDTGMQDVQYSVDTLVDILETCARHMEQAERYEILGELYKLIIPVYEAKRDYARLAECYDTLCAAYNKVVEVMRTGKRLLGKFFRVAFFGQLFEEEDGKVYIYKEPKVTGLPEICERLKGLYSEKYGKGNVKLIMDSNKVNPKDLDSRYAYIQVTYVTPYFDEAELENRQTDFEKNNNIRKFMYETPFTKDPKKARGSIEDQWKRRTILTTSNAFPYVKKRIQVAYAHELELSPIEVAIDEMQIKVADLREVVNLNPPDLKKLQLKLQGSVSVQVNAGPLAYAEAFLDRTKGSRLPKSKVDKLKDVYRHFVEACGDAVDLNAGLILSEQYEYHESLKHGFKELKDRLSEIMQERVIMEEDRLSTSSSRSSLTLFNAISATGSTSTV